MLVELTHQFVSVEANFGVKLTLKSDMRLLEFAEADTNIYSAKYKDLRGM